jgi:hypothetical protein
MLACELGHTVPQSARLAALCRPRDRLVDLLLCCVLPVCLFGASARLHVSHVCGSGGVVLALGRFCIAVGGSTWHGTWIVLQIGLVRWTSLHLARTLTEHRQWQLLQQLVTCALIVACLHMACMRPWLCCHSQAVAAGGVWRAGISHCRAFSLVAPRHHAHTLLAG